MPLIEFKLPIYANENTKYWNNKVHKTILSSSSSWDYPKNTSNKLTKLLLGYDFHLRAYYMQNISRDKWAQRRKDSPRTLNYRKSSKPNYNTNLLSKTPKELISYINLFNSYCPQCHCINNISHLRDAHSYQEPSIDDLLTLFQSTNTLTQKKKRNCQSSPELSDSISFLTKKSNEALIRLNLENIPNHTLSQFGTILPIHLDTYFS